MSKKKRGGGGGGRGGIVRERDDAKIREKYRNIFEAVLNSKESGSLVIPRHFFAFFGETRARRVSNRYPRDDALSKPPGHHPSSRKSVRIGESSSIKGPISDDKDLG